MGRLNAEQDAGIHRLDGCRLHHHNGRFVRTRRIGRAETNKVVAAHQQGRGLCHTLRIQRFFHPPYAPLVERRLSGRNLVTVGARNGVVAGMKRRGSALHGENRDVRRKPVVQSAQDLLRMRNVLQLRTQMRHLPERVHSRVGSA